MSKHTIDRQALAMRIQQLEGLTNDEKAALLELLNTRKKYGLVWEDKPEQVEEELRSKIPVFTEVKDRAIINDTPTEHYPNHLLIEGDNLQALTTLAYTHEGKIDVIYIDPPYNTGNKDFVYNDHFVDSEDSYRHSKWLSFMSKRLEIAKRLLSDKGVIFISIDDNEQANLKLLCDEVFGQYGFVGNIIWQSRTSISNDDYISTNHNHTFIYSRNRENIVFYGEKIGMEGYINPDGDPRGPWKLVPIDANHPGGDTVYGIVNPKTGVEYFPPNNRIWAYSRSGMQKLLDDGRIKFGINDDSSPKKKLFYYERIEKGDTKTPSSLLLDAKTTKDGTNELIDILSEKKFDYPKPSSFIKRLLTYSSLFSKNHNILDFFAGSGTTLHATMQLNAEDGGRRQCILVTNNENNICEEVTYERNKRVINGYTTPKGEQVEGLHHNNLRYYKTELVERENSQQNRKALMKASADLLCIKEDIYTEKDELNGTKFNKQYIRFYQDGDCSMLLVFDPRAIDSVVERLGGMAFVRPVKVYVYSADEYPYTDDFAPVADKVQLVALPTALRKALQNVLPADGPQRPVEGLEPAADATAGGDLFNQPTGEE